MLLVVPGVVFQPNNSAQAALTVPDQALPIKVQSRLRPGTGFSVQLV